jgi:hypothetical protein
MTDQNVTRTYRVFVPSGYKPSTPPLWCWYSMVGEVTRTSFLTTRTSRRLADQRGYIVVAPRGLGSAAPDLNRNSWSFRGSTTGLAGPSEDGGTHSPKTTAGAICDPALTPNYTYASCRNIARNTCSWTQCQADDVAFTLTLVTRSNPSYAWIPPEFSHREGRTAGCLPGSLGQNAASAPIFQAIAPIIGLPHRGYLDAPRKIRGHAGFGNHRYARYDCATRRLGRPSHTTTSDVTGTTTPARPPLPGAGEPSNSCPYIGTPAASFQPRNYSRGLPHLLRHNAAGWSGGSAGGGWPNVLDCRAPMGHTYDLGWSWKLILDFFDAHSR